MTEQKYTQRDKREEKQNERIENVVVGLGLGLGLGLGSGYHEFNATSVSVGMSEDESNFQMYHPDVFIHSPNAIIP